MNLQELNVKIEYALSHEFNHTLHVYIDIADDLIAGTLLGQILYWFSPTKDGKRKTKVFKDNNFWLAKKREEWTNEIRISPKQYDRAISVLESKGFVEVKKFRFNGSPTTHIRPLYEQISNAISNWKQKKAQQILNSNADGENELTERDISNFTFGEFPILPLGENELTERDISLTEITSKTTTKNKNNIIDEFETLWKMYPNKKGKDKALGYYQKARKSGTTYEEVEQGIKNYCKEIEVKKTSQQYIKHGSTWFNNKGWLDEYDITSESNQTNQPKKKEFNFIPTGVAESGEEYMEIDGKWFNRYGKELNSKGYEIIDFGLSKGW